MSSRPIYVGSAVKEIRNARNMTQAQLAEKSGMGLQSIQHIEAERRSLTPKSLSGIAAALSVPVTYLFLLVDETDDPIVCRFQSLARKSLGITTKEPMPA